MLHVVAAGELGGAERMLADLATPRPSEGLEHCVALLPAKAALEPFFREHGIEVHAQPPSPEHAGIYLARAFGGQDLRWLGRTIDAFSPNVLHLHTVGSQVLGTRAALRRRVPVLRTEHSTRAYDDRTVWPFSRWSLRRVDAAVAISQHIADTVLQRAPWAKPKLHTIANGVDTARFARAELPAVAPFRFVLSGRLEPRKGIDIALEALALTPEAELCIVGDGPLRVQLEQQAARLGVTNRTLFVGHQPDVRPHLRSAHAVLSSSRKEGLGLAVLEAMAMGRPAVAVPVGGLPEFVNKSTGFLAATSRAQDLAAAMTQAIQAPNLTALGQTARQLVEQQYSIEAMRERYAALYRQLSLRCAP